MHLDTVMTHIDVDTFSVYPEVVRPDVQCWTLTPDGHGGLKRTQENTLVHALEKALGINQIRLITTGATPSKPNVSSGMTQTTSSRCVPAWWWAMSATSGPTKNTTKRASPFYPFTAMNLDADAAVPAA